MGSNQVHSFKKKVLPSQGQKFGSSQLAKLGASNGANDLHNQELLMCPRSISNFILTLM